MKLITRNFRLNALANQFSAAVYHQVCQENNGEWFPIDACGKTIHVAIIGGVDGIRELVDACFLPALKDAAPNWEEVGIRWLSLCVENDYLTEKGRELWASMCADMGESAAKRGGMFHA